MRVNRWENIDSNKKFFASKRFFWDDFKAEDLLLIVNEDFVLELPLIRYISDDDAKYLSQIGCGWLVLNWLTNITVNQAELLSAFKWWRLWLWWLTRTSTEVLKSLINFEWDRIEVGFSHDIKKEDLALLKKFKDNNQECIINFGRYPLWLSDQMLIYVRDNIKFCEDNGLFLKGSWLSYIDIVFEDKEVRKKLRGLVWDTNVFIDYHL